MALMAATSLLNKSLTSINKVVESALKASILVLKRIGAKLLAATEL